MLEMLEMQQKKIKEKNREIHQKGSKLEANYDQFDS